MQFKFRTFVSILLTVLITFSVFAVNAGAVQVETITDLDQCASYTRPAVEYLINKGIISGSNGKFNPSDSLTRAQMVKMLVASLGMDISDPPAEPSFKDVTKAHWGYPYIETALKNGIVTIGSDKIFNPDEKASREQMAAMFIRALGITDEMLLMNQKLDTVPKLSDNYLVSSWASNSVEFALDNGIMVGVGGNRFAPRNKAERQQAALVIYRFLMNKDTFSKVKSGFKVGYPFITLGSTKKDVQNIMGPAFHYIDHYDLLIMEHYSTGIKFYIETTIDGVNDNSKVIGWENSRLNNKLVMGPKDPTALPFKIGSTMYEVAKSTGTPKDIVVWPNIYAYRYEDRYWLYPDNSVVIFDQNYKVKHYINNGGLKVSLGAKDSEAPPIKYKSTKQDVVRSAGTPDMVNSYFLKNHDYKSNGFMMNVNEPSPNTYYQYRNSYIVFDTNGKIIELVNTGNLNVDFGTADPAFPGFTLGSNGDDIVKAMGTPDRILGRSWYYGESYVTTDSNGIVTGWFNRGNLKFTNKPGDPNAPVISLGSSKQEVLNRLGTPASFEGECWNYNPTTVWFDSTGHVVRIIKPTEALLSNSVKDESSPGFIFGSTADDVIKAMGSPTGVIKDGYLAMRTAWVYDNGRASRVFFDDNGKVLFWQGYNSTPLKLAQPQEYDPNAPSVTLGLTQADVIRTLGSPLALSEPENVTDNIWMYTDGQIRMVDGKVAGWKNPDKKLKIFLQDSVDGASFTYGSTKLEVAEAMGTPDSIWTGDFGVDTWYYGNATVAFKDGTGTVIGWTNAQNLKLTVRSQSAATFIIVGSTRDDVLKVMGIPDKIWLYYYSNTRTYWAYGLSKVVFNQQGIVVSLENLGNNLILQP